MVTIVDFCIFLGCRLQLTAALKELMAPGRYLGGGRPKENELILVFYVLYIKMKAPYQKYLELMEARQLLLVLWQGLKTLLAQSCTSILVYIGLDGVQILIFGTIIGLFYFIACIPVLKFDIINQ